MSETLSQIGHLFLESTPTVILVFLLLVVLDRWFFRPLTAILKEREEKTLGALARAREQVAEAEAKSREYEANFQAARQEVYRQREVDRRQALDERTDTLARARDRAESLLRDALAGLAAEVNAAKQELSSTGQSLARAITEAVLSSGTSSGGQGGARA
jgi:F0F1-type ATP synthase membrane subunit b/b'